MWATLAQIALQGITIFGQWYLNRLEQLKSARTLATNVQKRMVDRARVRSQKDRDEQSAKDLVRDRVIDILFSELKLPKNRS